MRAYNLTHLSDEVLVRDLTALVARDREITAALLAHIAEVDARRLYVAAGYPSMHAYCIGELRFSDDAAFKRIQVARAGRQFPAIFDAVADGRLHMTAVRTIAPYLTPENASELLAAAAHRSMGEIERLIALRFGAVAGFGPFDGVRAVLPSPAPMLEARAVEPAIEPANGAATEQQVLRPVEFPRKLADSEAERFQLQVMLDGTTRDKLEYARSLLGHAVPSGDLAKVLDRALDALIARLEKQKFAATDRPRRTAAAEPGRAARARHIPADMKRAVWERDGGRCTFLTPTGHRCPARKRLEFDHVVPVARGGAATAENLRLRCRTHNQHEAERAFGVGFMNERRAEARQARARAGGASVVAAAGAPASAAAAGVHAADETAEHMRDVYSALRNLGCRADQARRAAEHAATLSGASLEGRLRAALRSVGRKPTCVVPAGAPPVGPPVAPPDEPPAASRTAGPVTTGSSHELSAELAVAT